MPHGRGQGNNEWDYLCWSLPGLGFHDAVPHVAQELHHKHYFTWQCPVHVGNLKVFFVSDDELQTQSTLGELPGEALQEKDCSCHLTLFPGPWVLHPNREWDDASSVIVIVIKPKFWQRAVRNYEVLLWFLSLLGTQLPSPENHSSKTQRSQAPLPAGMNQYQVYWHTVLQLRSSKWNLLSPLFGKIKF